MGDCAWHDLDKDVEIVDGVALGENEPSAQGVHVRSAVVVACALKKVPAGQVAVCVVHAFASAPDVGEAAAA